MITLVSNKGNEIVIDDNFKNHCNILKNSDENKFQLPLLFEEDINLIIKFHNNTGILTDNNIFKVLQISEYLDYFRITKVCYEYIANQIDNKFNTEEIRSFINIPNDLTLQQRQQIRDENEFIEKDKNNNLNVIDIDSKHNTNSVYKINSIKRAIKLKYIVNIRTIAAISRISSDFLEVREYPYDINIISSSDNNNFVNDKWPKLTIKLLNIFNLVKEWCKTGDCIAGHISNWDVSNVTNMSALFRGYSHFNQPLNNWDVSNVMRMNYMFSRCSSFNQAYSITNHSYNNS